MTDDLKVGVAVSRAAQRAISNDQEDVREAVLNTLAQFDIGPLREGSPNERFGDDDPGFDTTDDGFLV